MYWLKNGQKFHKMQKNCKWDNNCEWELFFEFKELAMNVAYNLDSSDRYYDPRTSRFISEDPIHMLSGETNFYRYVGNSPLNQTDPFGLLSFQGNYERRKCINKSAFLSIVKTTVSIITGSEFLKSMAKTGFNTGLMDLIKNRFSVPGLTAGLGSIGNFAIAAAVKSVAYGVSFSAGIFTGNNIGAFFDTAVDNNESALGIDASVLSDLGFGSGVSGNGGYSCDGGCK